MHSRGPDPSPTETAAVQLRRVRREFPGGVVALEGIELIIGAREFVSILGPSGCGKSTLLRIIAGLDRATSGTVQADQRHIAYVFQDAHLLPWRNVLDNVALPLELSGVSRAQRMGRAMLAIEQVGLGDAIKRYAAQLSGGMRMRVSLARAMVTDPQLLLLDEPFAALDEITRQQLDEQLRALWLKRSMTVIFVTHSIGEAIFLARRAIVMSRRPGTIVLDHEINLVEPRSAALRGEPAFAAESKVLLDALQRGGATS